MSVVIIIPARLGSTRLPGKILADLNGKPLLWWTWQRAKKVKGVKEVYIAVDASITKKIMESCGAKVILTPKNCPSGTERAALAASRLKCGAVINVQADEPLFSIAGVEKMARLAAQPGGRRVITLAAPISSLKEALDPNNVKVVVNKDNNALYFSRSIIPMCRDERSLSEVVRRGAYLKHIGVYAYSRNTLLDSVRIAHADIENIEKLEQLKFLYNGFKIYVIKGNYGSIGVDTAEDLRLASKKIRTESGNEK